MASAKHSEIDIESEGKVLNLRRLQNRKIFVTSERSSAILSKTISNKTISRYQDIRLYQIKVTVGWDLAAGCKRFGDFPTQVKAPSNSTIGSKQGSFVGFTRAVSSKVGLVFPFYNSYFNVCI